MKKVAIGLGVATVGMVTAPHWLRGALELVRPSLPRNVPPGQLGQAEVSALRAATQAMLGSSVQLGHYEALFHWRAANRPGYRGLYQRFRATLDQAAAQTADCGFADCDEPTRTTLLRQLSLGVPLSPIDRGRLLVVNREAWLYQTYFAEDVLKLFSRTDALVAIGYDSWPGMPRGLDNYQHAPAS